MSVNPYYGQNDAFLFIFRYINNAAMLYKPKNECIALPFSHELSLPI